MCVCLWGVCVEGFVLILKILYFLLWLDYLLAASSDLFLGFLEEFSLFPNKTIGYKITLEGFGTWHCFTKRAVVKPMSPEKLRAFSWSCWIWRQAQPLRSRRNGSSDPEQNWRNFKRPLPGRRKRGSRVRLPKKQTPMPPDLFTFREGWVSPEGMAVS